MKCHFSKPAVFRDEADHVRICDGDARMIIIFKWGQNKGIPVCRPCYALICHDKKRDPHVRLSDAEFLIRSTLTE